MSDEKKDDGPVGALAALERVRVRASHLPGLTASLDEMASALRAYVDDDECKYGMDGQCDGEEPPCRFCDGRRALAEYEAGIAGLRDASRDAGMEEAPEPAMHYDSSGRPMHPVSECRPGVYWTDQPSPADLILEPLPRAEPERSQEATRRAEEMKRLLSRGDGEEG